MTKYINGSSDIIAGAVCADQELINQMVDLHTGSIMLLGPTLDPKTAFDISMRLPHLGIRVAEHSRRAMTFAERLVELNLPVTYPGLKSHPGHDILARDANEGFGFGGIFTIDLENEQRAFEFMEILQNEQCFGYIAVSLGYFDTLLSCSASSTSSEMSDEARGRAGISPGLVRISLGYTGSLEQRWKQFSDALKKLGAI